MPANHWNVEGDLVVEQKTLFRPVGWFGQSGAFYPCDEPPTSRSEPGGFAPIYQQIATWIEGEGWND